MRLTPHSGALPCFCRSGLACFLVARTWGVWLEAEGPPCHSPLQPSCRGGPAVSVLPHGVILRERGAWLQAALASLPA